MIGLVYSMTSFYKGASSVKFFVAYLILIKRFFRRFVRADIYEILLMIYPFTCLWLLSIMFKQLFKLNNCLRV